MLSLNGWGPFFVKVCETVRYNPLAVYVIGDLNAGQHADTGADV